MIENNLYQFTCHSCDFKCNKKSKFDRHILSEKHKYVLKQYNEKIKLDISCKKTSNIGGLNKYICECGKEYKHRQSLFNHKKKCKINECVKIDEYVKIDENNSDLIKHLINQNKELINENKEIVKTIINQQKTIENLAPKVTHITNNTINNTNIILMLNDKFKDAVNLDDFIKSLTISLEDLNLIKDKGLVKGITNTVISNLEKIDKDKRPVYCISNKKDSFYFKDKEQWEKDNNNEKIKETINKVAFEQRKSLDKWKHANPDFLNNENKQEEYLKLINVTTQDIENTENENKIVRKIYKEIQNI